ncbi:MAG: stage II sporulation protein R, partial [Clostridia bacterium]|nr:stage II sporulation protein R [Clostridia bacterium]
ITLPAGQYASLKIELGKAEGKNWWCVLFPQVCVGCARPAEALAEVGFTANQIKLLTEQEEHEYVVKFKLLEIVEGIFG